MSYDSLPLSLSLPLYHCFQNSVNEGQRAREWREPRPKKQNKTRIENEINPIVYADETRL